MERFSASVGDEGRGKYDAVLLLLLWLLPNAVGGEGSGLGSGEVCRAWRQEE